MSTALSAIDPGAESTRIISGQEGMEQGPGMEIDQDNSPTFKSICSHVLSVLLLRATIY